MLLIRGPPLKRAFLCSSCWAVGPVLNEFVVAMAFVYVDYSSNVGKGSRIFEGKTVNFREQYGRATREVPVEGDESGL
jgi:hypothetical protein